jgi:hypothetical protein
MSWRAVLISAPLMKCHSSLGFATAVTVSCWLFTMGDGGSCLEQSVWDLQWTKCHWDKLFTGCFSFPPLLSLHHCTTGQQVQITKTGLCAGGSQSSSVSIMPEYELDDRGPISRHLIFPLTSVSTGCGAHPASYTMGTVGPFLRGKVWLGRNADHSPHPVPRLRMNRSYTSSLLKRLHSVYSGTTLPLLNVGFSL